MKQDVTSDPIDIGFLGSDGVMLQSYFFTDLIEEFFRTSRHLPHTWFVLDGFSEIVYNFTAILRLISTGNSG